MEKDKGKILVALSGGGTGGPVVPLLSVARVLVRWHPEFMFLFIGTNGGPEAKMVEDEKDNLDICYFKIISGKLRRYFSWRNFIDPFLIVFSFFQSLFILAKYRPKVFLAAGAFVSVPPAWAARILGIPVLMHQQDVRPGLANQLIAPFASLKTVTFKKSLKDYSNAVWIGNPVDEQEISLALERLEETRKKYQLNNLLPVILVTGGGTGADFFNDLILENQEDFCSKFQIIHLSGTGKKRSEPKTNYQSHDFLSHSEILKLMAASDLVVSRCGLGTLTELSLLSKPSILIPIPNSHQEENAQLFVGASLVLAQENLSSKDFLEKVVQLMDNQEELKRMGKEINKLSKLGAADFLAEKIYEYSRKKN